MALVLLALAAACDRGRERAVRTPPVAAADSTAQRAPAAAPPADAMVADAWSRTALEEQPQMTSLRRRTPADIGAPATTPWRSVPASEVGVVKDSARSATPGALMGELVHTFGWGDVLGQAAWEQTSRVWLEDESHAAGIVMQWGFQDDAVAGRDRLVRMERRGGRWAVLGVQQREHCARRVTGAGLCG